MDVRLVEAARMRTSRFSETEIIYAVKQLEMGLSVKEIARKYGAH